MGKGSGWERELCKLLSLWWSEGEDDGLFWRTAMSGGRATLRARRGESAYGQSGDICSTHPSSESLFQYLTIEAKKGYNKLDLLRLMDGSQGIGKHELEQWIGQAKQSSQDAGVPHWWLIIRRDRRKPIIMIDRLLYSDLNSQLGPIPGESSIFLCRHGREGFCVLLLEDFLLWVPPSTFVNN